LGAIATIGVYEFTLEEFLQALAAHDVRQLLDVRQRRGVRGRQYAWANARRLQAALAEAGVEYRHHLELAPTTGMRELQYRADDRAGVGKRSRVRLDPEYEKRYLREILDPLELDPLVADLPAAGCAALLCVERDPEACHRSLIAARLAEEFGLDLVHIRPDLVAPPANPLPLRGCKSSPGGSLRPGQARFSLANRRPDLQEAPLGSLP
jgi:uncharacterized protein (DUF488 family)